MDVETETMFKRVVSKIQETILTFRKQIEKVNSRVIHIEDRVNILEEFIQGNEQHDPSELLDMRARISNMDKNMKQDITNILQILQSMKEAQIMANSRIGILEDAIPVKDPITNIVGVVDEVLSETDKMLKEADKMLEEKQEKKETN